MTDAYNRWYKHYHDEGEKLRAHESQFRQRVTVWGEDDQDPRLPEAKYERLQAGIKYNSFIRDEGKRIDEDIAQIEKRLQQPHLDAGDKFRMDSHLAELNDKRQAWTQVLINDKHQAIEDLRIVQYNNRIYHPDGHSEWDRSTLEGIQQRASQNLGRMMDSVGINIQNTWDSISPETKQEVCKIVTGEAVNAAISAAVRTGGGVLADQAKSAVIDHATQHSVDSACEATFPTNETRLRDAFSLNEQTDVPVTRTDLPFYGRALNTQEQQWDQALDKHITPKLQAEGYSAEQIANVKTGCMLQMNNTCPDRDLQFASINPKFGKEGMVVMGIHNSYYTPTADLAATRDVPPDQQIHQLEQQQELQRQQQVAMEHSHSGPVRTM